MDALYARAPPRAQPRPPRRVLRAWCHLGLDGRWGRMCDQWKVLIYDRACRDIITPLLTVNQLRQQGGSRPIRHPDVALSACRGGHSIGVPVGLTGLPRAGITLYLDLHQERDPIPDVAAIYVVSPTNENIRRIAQDAGKALYRAMHVNFISPTPRVRAARRCCPRVLPCSQRTSEFKRTPPLPDLSLR